MLFRFVNEKTDVTRGCRAVKQLRLPSNSSWEINSLTQIAIKPKVVHLNIGFHLDKISSVQYGVEWTLKAPLLAEAEESAV